MGAGGRGLSGRGGSGGGQGRFGCFVRGLPGGEEAALVEEDGTHGGIAGEGEAGGEDGFHEHNVQSGKGGVLVAIHGADGGDPVARGLARREPLGFERRELGLHWRVVFGGGGEDGVEAGFHLGLGHVAAGGESLREEFGVLDAVLAIIVHDAAAAAADEGFDFGQQDDLGLHRGLAHGPGHGLGGGGAAGRGERGVELGQDQIKSATGIVGGEAVAQVIGKGQLAGGGDLWVIEPEVEDAVEVEHGFGNVGGDAQKSRTAGLTSATLWDSSPTPMEFMRNQKKRATRDFVACRKVMTPESRDFGAS